MGTVVELSIGWVTLTTTSNEMTRSTKSIDICLILFFLVVTMKNKSGRVKQKREKKTCRARILQKACCSG